MRQCEEWYNEYMKGGYTPEWTDSESDQDVLKYLKAYKPGKPTKGKRRRAPNNVKPLTAYMGEGEKK